MKISLRFEPSPVDILNWGSTEMTGCVGQGTKRDPVYGKCSTGIRHTVWKRGYQKKSEMMVSLNINEVVKKIPREQGLGPTMRTTRKVRKN